mgnify:CR=1 FL=1
MKFKWTLLAVIAVILLSVIAVATRVKESNQECFDAGGLIVQTHKGWVCVKEI